MLSLKPIITIFILISSQLVFAWGGRGHNTICESAAFLVKSPGLKEFLATRPHVMGHLCNIPDIYWKSLPADVRKSGDPGHYINPEKIGYKIEDVPLDYKKIIADFTGKQSKEDEKKTIFSVPDDVGHSWWRADQFFRLAVEAGQKAKQATAPKDFREEQDNESAFNKGIYQMMVNMGVMGHFIGDMGQPFHNTSDHDGWAANHGGIHSYYEDAIVAQLPGDLAAQVIKKAQSMKSAKFMNQATPIENFRALSAVSVSEMKDVIKADAVLKPSSLTIDKGMSLKKPAERKPASEVYKKFEKLIINQMARSALLLAQTWDEIYKKAGEPEVKAYRSFLYPFTPDFVKPDYFDLGEKKETVKEVK